MSSYADVLSGSESQESPAPATKGLTAEQTQQLAGLAVLIILGLLAFGWLGNLFGGGTKTLGEQYQEQQSAILKNVDVDVNGCTGYGYTDGAGGTIKNSSDELLSVSVEVGYYDDDGVKVDGGYDTVTVPAGRSAQFATSGSQNVFSTCRTDKVSAHKQ